MHPLSTSSTQAELRLRCKVEHVLPLLRGEKQHSPLMAGTAIFGDYDRQRNCLAYLGVCCEEITGDETVAVELRQSSRILPSSQCSRSELAGQWTRENVADSHFVQSFGGVATH